jgi:hypothetical protein
MSLISASSLTYSPPLFPSHSASSSLPSNPLPLHTPQLLALSNSSAAVRPLDSDSLEMSKSSDPVKQLSPPVNPTPSPSGVPASALSILTSMKTTSNSSGLTNSHANSSLVHSSSVPSSSSLARRSSYSSSISPQFGSTAFKSSFFSSPLTASNETIKEIIQSLQEALSSFSSPSSELRHLFSSSPLFSSYFDSALNFRSTVENATQRLNEMKSLLNVDEILLSPSKAGNEINSGLGLSTNGPTNGNSGHNGVKSEQNTLQLALTQSSPSGKLSLPSFVSASPTPTGAFHSSRTGGLSIPTPVLLSSSSTFKSPSFTPLNNPTSGIPSLPHSSHSNPYYPTLSPLFTSNSSTSGPVGISPRIQGLNSLGFSGSGSSLTPINRIPSAELPGQQQQAPSLNLNSTSASSLVDGTINRPPSPSNTNSLPHLASSIPPSNPTPTTSSSRHQSHSSHKSSRSSLPSDGIIKAKRGRGRLQKCEKHRKWKKSCPPTCPDKPKLSDGINVKYQSGSDSGSDSDNSSSSDSSDSSPSPEESADKKRKREFKSNKSKPNKSGKVQQMQSRVMEGIEGEFGSHNMHSHALSINLPLPAPSPTGSSPVPFAISPYNSSILSHLQVGTQSGAPTLYAPVPFTPSNSTLFQQSAACQSNTPLSHPQSSFFVSPVNRAMNFSHSNGVPSSLNHSSGSMNVHGMQYQGYELMSPHSGNHPAQRRY